ncbi:related to 3-oxoacyl-[acyl-carrier-protein] reductase [Rhynchosporium secalis]|uniref:Related to 3-oxoacyl-[acyl-carrier-protein] reductase n=1 Tax=Rhynchosporium secalis TaxID=38038 RepID=A0A1E1MAJ4_RHYSE|nr:related to 3-oxoacyl-[acyl-carrier-protein] reductase [Rhynchosporium secalis]
MSSIDAATLFSVQGLVAAITGGGSGIGLMMALALEANGATVYIIGRRLESLEKAASQGKHGNIIPMQGDVTKKEDLSSIADKITKRSGYLNVLIANSGISGPAAKSLPKDASLSEWRDNLWPTEPQEFDQTFSVNTSAVWFSVLAFLPPLEEGNKKGNVEQKSQVIATSSIGGFNRVPLAGFAYSASKAATTFMMKQFATALVPYDIRSNVIAPGLYPSKMADELIAKMEKSTGLLKSFLPAERTGTIEDMAGAILYLTSRAGGYLNENIIVTDGGRLSVLPSSY